MGLDNGIVVQRLDKDEIPEYVYIFDSHPQYVEIAYWRNWTALRANILGKVLYGKGDGYCEYILCQNDLTHIIQLCCRYFDYDEYHCNKTSTDFETGISFLAKNIASLMWLQKYWEENPSLRVYFYDSY